jgi:hypothetical protein
MMFAKTRSSGSILICVLVCLGISASIMMVSVRSSLRVRRQMRIETQLEQTRWLLEAGMRRGASRFREDPGYQGETWKVVPALASYRDATVEIKVTRNGVSGEQARMNVSARIGGQTTHTESTQRSATLLVQRTQSNSETE